MSTMKTLFGTWSGEPTDTVGAVFRHCEKLNAWKIGQPGFVRATRRNRKAGAIQMYRQIKCLWSSGARPVR